MRLSVRVIKNYQNINSFDYGTEWNIREGEANQLYYKLVDLDQDNLRYIPTGSSPSMQVIFPALDSNNTITKVATQVSALDGSIWTVSLSATEIPSSGNVQFTITENSITKRFVLQQGMVVELFNQGGC